MADLHTIWHHRWITPKAKCQDSKIAGLGVVAIKSIPKGETVGIVGGVVVPASEIKKYRSKMGHAGIQIDDDFFICPTSREEFKETGIFNHSCEPNIGYSSQITFVAIRDIGPGEELVFDYAFGETMFEKFECRCGSANCRKLITQDDWKLAQIQKKYGQYFSPYLKNRIKE